MRLQRPCHFKTASRIEFANRTNGQAVHEAINFKSRANIEPVRAVPSGDVGRRRATGRVEISAGVNIAGRITSQGPYLGGIAAI